MNEKLSGEFESRPEDVSTPEAKAEYIPTPEEVQSIFEQLIEGKEYKTDRQLEDEQGLCLWEVTVHDSEGDGYAEYGYMRKGRHETGGQASDTAIHVTFYDEDGIPVNGSSVAKFIDGKWELTP